MRNNKGFVLLSVLLILSLIMMAVTSMASLLVSRQKLSADQYIKVKSFYAAEAGVEWASHKLEAVSEWFTDASHSPADDVLWILTGASGEYFTIGDCGFKLIREYGRESLYCVGFIGDKMEKSEAITIVRVEFTSNPFTRSNWKIIK